MVMFQKSEANEGFFAGGPLFQLSPDQIQGVCWEMKPLPWEGQ